MNRRQVLNGGMMVGVGMALAACSAGQIAKVEKVSGQVVSDVNIIASGVSAILPGLSALGSVGSGVASAVGALVADAKSAAGAVSTALTTVAAAPFVSTVSADIKAVTTALSGVSLPSSIAGVLAAAKSLLPLVESAVGIATAVLAEPGGMSPEEARMVLAAAAQQAGVR